MLIFSTKAFMCYVLNFFEKKPSCAYSAKWITLKKPFFFLPNCACDVLIFFFVKGFMCYVLNFFEKKKAFMCLWCHVLIKMSVINFLHIFVLYHFYPKAFGTFLHQYLLPRNFSIKMRANEIYSFDWKIQEIRIKSVQWKQSKWGMAKEVPDEENDAGNQFLVFTKVEKLNQTHFCTPKGKPL